MSPGLPHVGRPSGPTPSAGSPHLVLLDSGYLDQRIWFLQAESADGITFELQVPDAFTQQQVVDMAEQVTFKP